jgi:hypothetical protein
MKVFPQLVTLQRVVVRLEDAHVTSGSLLDKDREEHHGEAEDESCDSGIFHADSG